MIIRNICSSYFKGVEEIGNCRKNSAPTNLAALLKIVSYFTIIIPAGFGIVYGIAHLSGRVCRRPMQNDSTSRVARPILSPKQDPPLIPQQPPEVKKEGHRLRPKQTPVQPKLENNQEKPILSGGQSPESRQPRPFVSTTHTHISTKKSSNGRTLEITLPTPGFTCIVQDSEILKSGAQVIVNAANSPLTRGGGVDRIIHQAGRASYASEHSAILKSYYNNTDSYPLGHATMITSGAMKQSYKIDNVIVVAGPQGPSSTPQKDDQLYACYYNSLILAHERNVTSIAFPSISTGVFNYPKDRAAAIFLQAVDNFSKQYPQTTVKRISLHVLYRSADLVFFEQAATQPSYYPQI